jgi:hypothetical protein
LKVEVNEVFHSRRFTITARDNRSAGRENTRNCPFVIRLMNFGKSVEVSGSGVGWGS